jgi:glycosyltransferase involved in cell wall biosynthesis
VKSQSPSDLQISLITFNRSGYLARTLSYLKTSPVRGCEIEIIDNASNDNTNEVVRAAQSEWPTLSYTRHHTNIGVVGNILYALHRATKPYLWLVCDDDYIAQDGWGDVIEQIRCGVPDIIRLGWECGMESTGRLLSREALLESEDSFLRSVSFCPNCIIRVAVLRRHLAACTIFGGYLFPHMAVHIKGEDNMIYYTSRSKLIERDNHDGIGRGYMPTFVLWSLMLSWLPEGAGRVKAFRQQFSREGRYCPFSVACSELARARLEAVTVPFDARGCYYLLLGACPPRTRIRICWAYLVLFVPRFVLKAIYAATRGHAFVDHTDTGTDRGLIV